MVGGSSLCSDWKHVTVMAEWKKFQACEMMNQFSLRVVSAAIFLLATSQSEERIRIVTWL